MISGGNRNPTKAELGNTGIRRERRGLVTSPSPPTATTRQSNRAGTRSDHASLADRMSLALVH